MYFKTHSSDNNRVLACADKNVVGKTFSDEKREVTVSESFYKGEETNPKKLAEMLGEFDSINLFGEHAVTTAMKQGLIREKDIIKIQGVKHVIILKV